MTTEGQWEETLWDAICLLEGHRFHTTKGEQEQKKLAVSDVLSLEEMIAQRSEAVAALEAERDAGAAAVAEQKTRLKEIKSQIKKLEKELDALTEQKAAEEAAAAAAAAKEAVRNRIDALLAEGKSLEDIMNMLG